MDKLKWLSNLLLLSIDKLLLLFGVILIVFAFNPVRYQNKKLDFCFASEPNWYLLIAGFLVLGYFFWRNRKMRSSPVRTTKIGEGYRLKFNSNYTVDVIFGDIQSVDAGNEYSAIVLPANTSFDDQCIKDKRSALGSFFQTHFPSGINEIQNLILKMASEKCNVHLSSFDMAPAGTTILLDKPLGSHFKVFVTAVTKIDPDKGIIADTLSLIASVKEVFKLASQQRISNIFMPVMGTGHGGLDFKAALSLILVQCIHCIKYEGSHHVHSVSIVVHDPHGQKREQISAVVESAAAISGG